MNIHAELCNGFAAFVTLQGKTGKLYVTKTLRQ